MTAPDPPSAWAPHQAAQQALLASAHRLAHAPADAPADAGALFHHACLLDQLGQADAARQGYLAVLAQEFGHGGALANLGALLAATGYASAARTAYAQAVASHPDDPAARVNLATLLREADPAEARTHYEAALALDPAHRPAHQGLSYLLDGVDEAAAARHRDQGFAGAPPVTGRYRGAARPVTVLQLVSARGGNIPTGRILDDRQFLTHTVVAEYADPAAALPPHDVVLNAIGDADRCPAALDAAAALCAATRAPVLNPPARIGATARAANAARLSALPGVVAPRMALLPRSAFAGGAPAGFAAPFLLRSPGFHTGQHFHCVRDPAALPGLLASLPGDPLLAMQYLDARGADGAYRKYRAMLIGGAVLPLHLAISADWKVHHYTAGMAHNPAHRAEEARFLHDMPGVLGPAATAALAQVAAALGLDYGGVDFALAPNGRLLLFEANTTMTLAPPPPGAMWDYRRPAFERALEAAQQLVLRTSGPARPDAAAAIPPG